MADFRKFFYHFGVSLTKKGSQLQGDCPFPDCPNPTEHFFVAASSGQYDCKVCGKAGNSYTFLNQLHDAINPTDLGWLVGNRGLKSETLFHFGVGRSPVQEDRWLLPCWNEKGKITNLYQAGVYKPDGKLEVRSSPDPCKQQLYLAHTITKAVQTVFICEGHWDALAIMEMLSHLRFKSDQQSLKLKASPIFLPEKNSVLKVTTAVGLPGATTIKPEWIRKFKDKDLILLQDNDESGMKCLDLIQKRISESNVSVNSLQSIRWKNGDPNDVRDMLIA